MPGGEWETISGTSQSAPQVSGMLALMREAANFDFNRDKIEAFLSESCKRVESREKNNRSGWGIIDMDKFLRCIELDTENLW